MNILVIGNGGREHALVWKISQSNKCKQIYTLPGNGGTAKISKNIDINIDDFSAIYQFIKNNNVNLVVIGPEQPLVNGLTDYLTERDIKVFGPLKKGAMLEGSKSFSKEFMQKYNIPTANYHEFIDLNKALAYLDTASYPTVIKADGLAAGKGVSIVQNKQEAEKEIKKIMQDKIFGNAGDKIVIENFLQGEEVSVLAFVDANTIIPMVPAQDHKAAYDGDQGPNTGGMGAYSPAPLVTHELMSKINKIVFDKVKDGFKQEGIEYRGILYAGLMVTESGPKVLEFNVRFGDPETQAILPRLDTDLVEIMQAVCDDKLNTINIKWKKEYAVSVVLASGGYPGNYEKNKKINMPDLDALVFQAGTKIDQGILKTSGGRVLAVTVLAKTLPEAIKNVYKNIEKINFEKKYYRKDIGKKALKYLNK